MAMERHLGALFMISVRGVLRSGASFGTSSHADKKSPAAIEAFAITIRAGRDGLNNSNAAARLDASIEPRLGNFVENCRAIGAAHARRAWPRVKIFARLPEMPVCQYSDHTDRTKRDAD